MISIVQYKHINQIHGIFFFLYSSISYLFAIQISRAVVNQIKYGQSEILAILRPVDWKNAHKKIDNISRWPLLRQRFNIKLLFVLRWQLWHVQTQSLSSKDVFRWSAYILLFTLSSFLTKCCQADGFIGIKIIPQSNGWRSASFLKVTPAIVRSTTIWSNKCMSNNPIYQLTRTSQPYKFRLERFVYRLFYLDENMKSMNRENGPSVRGLLV